MLRKSVDLRKTYSIQIVQNRCCRILRDREDDVAHEFIRVSGSQLSNAETDDFLFA